MKELETTLGSNLPYDKFIAYGPSALTEAELLAIIIRTGTSGSSAMELATQILNLGKSKSGLLDLHHITTQELMSIKGIGQVKAIKIKSILELAKRLSVSYAKKNLKITEPKLVANYFMERMRHLEQEIVYVVLLDTKNHILGEQVVSSGTATMSLVCVREIMQIALSFHAISMILLHNHPSGDPTPSMQDIDITKKLYKAGLLMEIPLLDHIIIGDKNYTSFQEKQLL